MSRRSFLPYVKKGSIVLVFLILLLLARSLIFSILSTKDRSQMIQQLQSELSQKKKEQAYLSQKLYYAKTDAFVEEEARSKLGLIKEGEKVVVDEKIQPEKPQIAPEEVPNWQKWEKLFF